jgi:hypothetical protein
MFPPKRSSHRVTIAYRPSRRRCPSSTRNPHWCGPSLPLTSLGISLNRLSARGAHYGGTSAAAGLAQLFVSLASRTWGSRLGGLAAHGGGLRRRQGEQRRHEVGHVVRVVPRRLVVEQLPRPLAFVRGCVRPVCHTATTEAPVSKSHGCLWGRQACPTRDRRGTHWHRDLLSRVET